MKFLLILLIPFLFGCKPEPKGVNIMHNTNHSDSSDDYMKICEGIEECQKMSPEDWLIENKDFPKNNPIIRVYPDEKYEYFELGYINDENVLFKIMKDIFCSDNPYAKELIEKYKITAYNIKCP